jgi:hypothetical protein
VTIRGRGGGAMRTIFIKFWKGRQRGIERVL